MLLEDIDATKPPTWAGTAAKTPNDNGSEGEDGQKHKNTVTLSGILNAIDGVGAAGGKGIPQS